MLLSQNIDQYSAQQLCHIAWAFGALSLRHGEFFTKLAGHICKNLTMFKAQGLSNIAWACAMVSFRDDRLLHLMAPEIAKDVGDLRPLALARCAWAYRVLVVHTPNLMHSIVAEASKKIQEFPTKALAKLADAVYLLPPAKAEEENIIESELDKRTADIYDVLSSKIGTSVEEVAEADWTQYRDAITQLGIADTGMVGTPMMLKRLNIGMPSFEFIGKCKQQQILDRAEGGSPSESSGFSAAEIELTWNWENCTDTEWCWQDFLMRYTAGGSFRPGAQVRRKTLDPATGAVLKETYEPLCTDTTPAGNGLVSVEVGDRFGKQEPAFVLLDDIHCQLRSAGVVQPQASIRGLLQLYSSEVPSISTLGAVHQFNLLYPSVTVEFSEQANFVCD
jgi:hypothetical protein